MIIRLYLQAINDSAGYIENSAKQHNPFSPAFWKKNAEKALSVAVLLYIKVWNILLGSRSWMETYLAHE